MILHLAAYAIVVRGSEYDLPPDILDDIVAQSISAFSPSDKHSESRGQARRHRDNDIDGDYDDNI